MMWSLGTGGEVVSATAEALLKGNVPAALSGGDRKAWRFRREALACQCFAVASLGHAHDQSATTGPPVRSSPAPKRRGEGARSAGGGARPHARSLPPCA